MAEFYDISGWQEKPHLQTGGTRNKAVFEHPQTGDLYYFKTSLKKEVLDHKYEFWSEIIASEVGRALGFDTLRYDIACHKDKVGCLSKSMVNAGSKLFEGTNYLAGYDPTYDPRDKSSYAQYTFRFIEKALNEYRLKDKIGHLIRAIIFDSLIGNGDRHQGNWGFIVPSIADSFMADEKKKNSVADSTVRRMLTEFGVKKSAANLIVSMIKGEF
jgi:hypothetical protein